METVGKSRREFLCFLDHVPDRICHGPLESQIQRTVVPLVVIPEEAPGKHLDHNVMGSFLYFPLIPGKPEFRRLLAI